MMRVYLVGCTWLGLRAGWGLPGLGLGLGLDLDLGFGLRAGLAWGWMAPLVTCLSVVFGIYAIAGSLCLWWCAHGDGVGGPTLGGHAVVCVLATVSGSWQHGIPPIVVQHTKAILGSGIGTHCSAAHERDMLFARPLPQS